MMKSKGYNPLTFFWIATYSDGTALPQFDPETGRENSFQHVDHSKLETFGWYPLTANMASKIGVRSYIKPQLPHFTIKLTDGKKLVAKRRNTIKTFRYCECEKCGFRWQFTPAPVDPLIGLLTSTLAHVEYIPVETVKGPETIKYVSAVCPSCGYHDCNAIPIKDKRVKTRKTEVRATVYILGYDDGVKLLIDEHGNAQLAYKT